MAREYPHPRNWSEMSADFRLMMGFHVCMMVLWIVGSAVLSVADELAIAGSLFAVGVAISLRRRHQANWRWPRIGIKEIGWATLGVVLVSVFAFAASPFAPPTTPRMLPWYLAVTGIGTFNTLKALRLVTMSEEEFLAQCGDATPPVEHEPRAAKWRQVVRGLFNIAFMVVWLAGVASFYFFGVGMRDGTTARTALNSEALTDHGRTVYVTMQTAHVIGVLQIAMFAGIPTIMLVGAILHFGLKIPVFGLRMSKGE